ncbi:MAG TPA: hypothetical protein VI300_04275, partial [Solirubrobacter sp.]
QWAGARNAESYELEIDDVVVRSAIARDASSVTVGALTPGQHSWRMAAVNQFGRTLSERRLFTAVAGFKYVALGDSYSSGEGVPVDGYFDGHEICGSKDDDWMNSPTFKHNAGGGWKDWGATDQTFHPNEKGHKDGYAAAVNDALNPGPVPDLNFANYAAAPVRTGASGAVSLAAQKVSCPAGGPGCTVLISVTAPAALTAAKRPRTIGAGGFSLRPGKSRPIAFKLAAAGRRALAKAKRLRATVTVVAYRGGRSTTQTATIELRAPKRKR